MSPRRRAGKQPKQPKRPDEPPTHRQLIPPQHERHLHLVVLVVGFLACGLVSLKLGQDNNWDLRNYHYYNPHALLNDRIGQDIAPAQRQSYFNPLADFPYYLGTNHLNPKLYGFILGGVQGLTLWLIFALCFVFFRNLSANDRLGLSLLCGGLGVYAPVFVGEIGTAMNDSLLGLLVLTAVYLFVRSYVERGSLAAAASRRYLVTGSFVFGAAAGFKLTLMLYALGAAVGLVVAERNWRDRMVVIRVWSLAFLSGFLLVDGWWMVRMWREFENPLFPHYNELFKSHWALPRSYDDPAMLPKTVWETVTQPFAFLYDSHYTKAQHGFRDARYAVLYVLFLVSVPMWIYRSFVTRGRHGSLSPESRFLLALFVVTYVVWEAKFSFIRYTASLESLAPLIVVILIGYLAQKSDVRAVIAALCIAPTVLLMEPIHHPRLPWADTFWDVQVPRLVDPGNTLVFQANPRPWSYLWPMFQPGVRFISVKNNLMYPEHDTRMNEEIRALIASHKGDMFLISRSTPYNWLQHDGGEMEKYGLKVISREEKPITSRHSRPNLILWRLEKAESTSTGNGS